MTYPQSSAVSAGDATLAAHYNNLRKDALYLGQENTDAIPLGTLLERYESRLSLERLSTDQVRVPASATAPVSLMVDGYLVQAVANVDLDAGDAPSGGAAAYYVFANRADSATTFTLSISTSSTELANQRRIGRFYWDGLKIVKDSVRTEKADDIKDLLYMLESHVCDGRLTLSTGVPVPVTDVAASATVYFTPMKGNRISLYVNDHGWRVYSFTELSLDISGIATDTNFDVWIYNNAGSLTLAYTEWANDTLRATNITRQDGVFVKSGSPEYRYLGTVRTSGAGTAEDTEAKRFVFNYYNRSNRPMKFIEETDSWTYSTASTARPLNNATDNRFEFVVGVNDAAVYMHAAVFAENDTSNNAMSIGIALDATNTHADASVIQGIRYQSAGDPVALHAMYCDFPGVGYHYLQVTEFTAGGTATFYGDAGKGVFMWSGAVGYIFA